MTLIKLPLTSKKRLESERKRISPGPLESVAENPKGYENAGLIKITSHQTERGRFNLKLSGSMIPEVIVPGRVRYEDRPLDLSAAMILEELLGIYDHYLTDFGRYSDEFIYGSLHIPKDKNPFDFSDEQMKTRTGEVTLRFTD